MKFLKLAASFLVCVVIVTMVLSWLTPVKQTADRSVTIQAPAADVFKRISRLEYFTQFAVWCKSDTAARYQFSGIDGTTGASTEWQGDPFLSGEGKMTITAVDPGKSITQSIEFISPKKRKAISVFTLSEANGVTTVTWHFEIPTPRPWNIFNLFSSLDKEMGNDFETSLNTLRDMVQSTPGLTPLKEFAVQEVDLPAATYLQVKQQIRKDDISTFCAQHFPLLKNELIRSNLPVGINTGIIYTWEPGAVAEFATGIKVPEGTKTQNHIMQVYELPAAKALQVSYFGNYGKEADAYASIDKYIADKKLKRLFPALEEYVRGPVNETDTLKWETRILVRVE